MALGGAWPNGRLAGVDTGAVGFRIMLLIPSSDFLSDELLPNSNRMGPGAGSLGPCHNFLGLALLESPKGDAIIAVLGALGLRLLLGCVEVKCCTGGLSARGSDVLSLLEEAYNM